MIYLDNAATTLQKPDAVEAAVCSAMRRCAGAGRSGHGPAMQGGLALLECRITAAKLFDLDDPTRVVFTHNATDAINRAIKSILRGGEQVLVSALEHNAVMRPLYALRQKGVRTTVVPTPLFDPDRIVTNFQNAIRQRKPDLVVCTCVSNVFGCILPIERIDRICARAGVPLIIDASQSAGTIPLSARTLHATKFICMPGHKSLYGPQGTGLLLCLGETMPQTLIEGGTGSDSESLAMPAYLPDRLEAGTHNVPGIAGLDAGMRFVLQRGVDEIRRHHQTLIRVLAQDLSVLPGARVFCADRPDRQAGVLSVCFDGVSCEALAARLAEEQICTRAGLHCAPIAHDSVGTLPDGTLRFSVSCFNTVEELKITVQTCEKTVKSLK